MPNYPDIEVEFRDIKESPGATVRFIGDAIRASGATRHEQAVFAVEASTWPQDTFAEFLAKWVTVLGRSPDPDDLFECGEPCTDDDFPSPTWENDDDDDDDDTEDDE